MPKTKVDYSKTVIYKIVCNDLNVKDIYIGSTTDFTRRKYNHNYNCSNVNGNKYHYKLYQCIRDYGDWDNWSMLEIEKYPCNDKREAELRERYYYELLNANLNTKNPSRTKTEYMETNKEKFKKIRLEYYNKNKDIIDLYRKEMFECNCGGKYSYQHKQRHLKTKKHQDYIALEN